MITPGLLRRAIVRGARWRLLLIWWIAMLLPAFIASLPMLHFLTRNLERLPKAQLDGALLLELQRQLGEQRAFDDLHTGLLSGLLVLLFTAPFAAGAAVSAAQRDEPQELRELLSGAGAMYGRMLRTMLCGAIPLCLGAAIAGGSIATAIHFVKHATSETHADRDLVFAIIPAAAAIFVGHLLLDATRAQFAAEPLRRSALAALWAGVRLLVRRPARTLLIGLTGALLPLLVSALLLWLRLGIAQKNAMMVALAWIVAQIAQMAIGWGRNARIAGLAELARADRASRLSAAPASAT